MVRSDPAKTYIDMTGPASSSTDGSPSSQSAPSPSRGSSRSSIGLSAADGSKSYRLEMMNLLPYPSPKSESQPEDGLHRSSLDSLQTFKPFTLDEEKAVLKKLDRKLVLFTAFLYSLSFLDRSNIGNARIAGLQDDLELSSHQYEWLLRGFYFTYILFEWMTLMYRLIPPHIYISLCVLSWGLLASLQALSTSFRSLLILRTLLGISEAAFGPGLPFYLSFFFRPHELAFRTGLFISASPLSASFAGGLACLITEWGEKGPIRPWRLLFLLEGFPSVVVAVWAWDFVPDGPGAAKWLNPREKEIAVRRLENEERVARDQQGERNQYGQQQKSGIDIHEVLQTLKDPKCYLTAAMFFSCNVAFSSMPVFMPTIVHDMGYSPLYTQALTAPPYLFAFVMVLATAYLSDRLQSRSTFVMLHSLLATSGYAIIALSGYCQWTSNGVRYFALYPAAAGFFSAITIIITWTINNQETYNKKGTGMAILNLIGQIGPLVGTSIFPDKDGPYYVRGMSICAAFMLSVGVMAAVLRWTLLKQNALVKHSGTGEYIEVPLDEGAMAPNGRERFEYML